MRTAATVTTAHRPFTNRMVVALFLATGILTACVPTAAMANEPTPTASASASSTAGASSKATASAKSDVVTVGAGGIIVAHSDALIKDPETQQAVGSLAPGETAQWISTNTAPSPAEHLVSTELGIAGTVSDMSVFLFPEGGLKLDHPIQATSAVGKQDTMSGFGGRLTADAMEIRNAPSPDGESLATAKIGAKYMASKLVKGKDSLMGQSMWAVVLLDADTQSYGFLRAEAISVDQDPTAAETVVATEPDQEAEATDAAPAEPAESAEATASVTAPPAAVVTELQEAPADESTNMLPLLTGLGGLAVGIVIGAVATRRKGATEPADTKSGDGDEVDEVGVKADMKAESVEEEQVEAVDAASYWDEED